MKFKNIIGLVVLGFLVIGYSSSQSNKANTQIPPETNSKAQVKAAEVNKMPTVSPQCTQDEFKSKICTDCNKAISTYLNSNCTTYTSEIDDSSCSDLCLKSEYIVEPTPKPVTIYAEPEKPEYVCSCSKTCSQMISCDEAYYQLNQCGCNKRDGDNDGIPCEDIC